MAVFETSDFDCKDGHASGISISTSGMGPWVSKETSHVKFIWCLLAGSAALAVVSLFPSATASAAVRPHRQPVAVLSCAGHRLDKPGKYVMSCGDGNAWWTGVKWSSFGTATARGIGDLHQNNCVPNCAGGRFVTFHATVKLHDVVATRKYGRLYAKATFSYRSKDKAQTETFYLAT